MNEHDIPRDHAAHPEELLATYVDGDASELDRATVRALLARCDQCRSDVELAVQAKAALQALPVLEAPGLADERLLRSTEPRRQPASARPGVLSWLREWSGERLAWGAGIVAAGSLVALFVLVQFGGNTSQEQAAPGQRPAPESMTTFAGAGRDYSPASLDALARQLVESERSTLAAQQPAAPTGGQAGEDRATGDRAAKCLRQGGGLPSGARPVHIENAKFAGAPAFIGAFQSAGRGSGRYLLVLAVHRETCDPLYVINRSL